MATARAGAKAGSGAGGGASLSRDFGEVSARLLSPDPTWGSPRASAQSGTAMAIVSCGQYRA